MLFKAISSKRSAKVVLQVENPSIGLKFRNEVAGHGTNEDEIKPPFFFFYFLTALKDKLSKTKILTMFMACIKVNTTTKIG